MAEPAPVSIETTDLPLIHIRIRGEYSGEDVYQAFDELNQAGRSWKQPFVVVYHTGGFLISADTRVVIGDRIQELFRQHPKNCRGVVVVVKSVISRMMAKGALLLLRQSHHVKLVDAEEQALRQAKAWLE